MTGGPDQPYRGNEFPPVDPQAPLEYPLNPALPPPVYPAGGYGGYPYPVDPYDPYRQTKPPGTNGKAIAALVVALTGLACCGFPSIVGLVLGVIAMSECRRTGQDGYGLALAGVIVAAVVIALWGLYIGVMIVAAFNGLVYSP